MDGKVERSRRQRHALETARLPGPQIARRADPDLPAGLPEEILDRGARPQTWHLPQLLALDLEEARRAPGPQRARRIRGEDREESRTRLMERAESETLLRCGAGGEGAVAVARQVPLLAENPQRTAAVLGELDDAAASQHRHPLAVEHLEADTVEAHQPVERGEPEIPVPRLERLRDPGHGQTVADPEDLVHRPRSCRQRHERARPAGTARTEQAE